MCKVCTICKLNNRGILFLIKRKLFEEKTLGKNQDTKIKMSSTKMVLFYAMYISWCVVHFNICNELTHLVFYRSLYKIKSAQSRQNVGPAESGRYRFSLYA
ncbi:hypothetical protein KIL84_012552 [Mauremys mutica]|uniref:Uncharacterized protein n=1 Tax=Mauremys mutica TaxID=74926 RepID=A0A9D3XS88_9SAUR|nr:hypothetical protein KIL84_012552 [Mauremys mutica]